MVDEASGRTSRVDGAARPDPGLVKVEDNGWWRWGATAGKELTAERVSIREISLALSEVTRGWCLANTCVSVWLFV